MSSSRRARSSPYGRQLSDHLLKRIGLEIQHLRSVVVMPDGPLWYLPFHALPWPEGVSGLPGGSALGDLAPVYYTPSATILAELVGRELRLPDELESWRTLVVAQTELPGEYALLPGAIEEASVLRGALRGKTIFLEGASATKSNFLEALPKATHIHIASHAVADITDEEPFILFSGSDQAQRRLYAHEISARRLSADLVFLSACSTSIGRQSTGEGLMSLARAFLLAGCRCVIASLWPIDDQEAPRMVREFYDRLSAGESIGNALHSARDQFQHSGGSVRSWAALQALGDADSRGERYQFILSEERRS